MSLKVVLWQNDLCIRSPFCVLFSKSLIRYFIGSCPRSVTEGDLVGKRFVRAVVSGFSLCLISLDFVHRTFYFFSVSLLLKVV